MKMEEDLKMDAFDQISDTAKHAIKENKVLSAKVTSLSRECSTLGDKNFSFETEWKRQREIVSVLRMSERQLISKNILKMTVRYNYILHP